MLSGFGSTDRLVTPVFATDVQIILVIPPPLSQVYVLVLM